MRETNTTLGTAFGDDSRNAFHPWFNQTAFLPQHWLWWRTDAPAEMDAFPLGIIRGDGSWSKIQSIMKSSCILPPSSGNMAFHINRFTAVHFLSKVMWNYSQLVSPPLHLLRWLQSRVQSYPGIPRGRCGAWRRIWKKEWHLSGYARLYAKAISTFSSQVSQMRIRKERDPASTPGEGKWQGKSNASCSSWLCAPLPWLSPHLQLTTRFSPPWKCKLHADKIHVFSSTCSQQLAHFPTWTWTNTRITVYPVSHC